MASPAARSPMAGPKFRRRRKLIKPRIQLRLTLAFVGLSALSMLLLFVLFTNTLTSAALALPHDGLLLMQESTRLLLTDLLVAFLVFLPLTFAIGVLATFRLAGPLYRFETFLHQMQEGESPPDFTLRKGDELQEIGRMLVEVTRPLRAEQHQDGAAAPEGPEAPSLVVCAEPRPVHEEEPA